MSAPTRCRHQASQDVDECAGAAAGGEEDEERGPKNLGKSNAKAKAVEDNGLEIHEFLECLVNLAFSRANPKYGQVGKSDVAAGGIEMDLLPGCLESLLKTNILVKAKRDNVPAWMDEIVSSAECQKAILDRR